jgi:hypothetical protein
MCDTWDIVCPGGLIPKRVRRVTFFNKVIKQSEILHGKSTGRVDLRRNCPHNPPTIVPRLLNLNLWPLACQASLGALGAIGVVLGALKRRVSICRLVQGRCLSIL